MKKRRSISGLGDKEGDKGKGNKGTRGNSIIGPSQFALSTPHLAAAISYRRRLTFPFQRLIT